jgi:hypothetical protein
VLLETVASGEKNWSISFQVPTQQAFAQLNVTGGQVVFQEHPSGDNWRLEVGKLLIGERLTGGYTGRLKSALNDIPVNLFGSVKPEGEIADKKETITIEGQADVSEATLTFEGLAFREAKGPVINGKVRTDIPNSKVLGKLM